MNKNLFVVCEYEIVIYIGYGRVFLRGDARSLVIYGVVALSEHAVAVVAFAQVHQTRSVRGYDRKLTKGKEGKVALARVAVRVAEPGYAQKVVVDQCGFAQYVFPYFPTLDGGLVWHVMGVIPLQFHHGFRSFVKEKVCIEGSGCKRVSRDGEGRGVLYDATRLVQPFDVGRQDAGGVSNYPKRVPITSGVACVLR
jgi:hypothetical protein